MLFSYTNVEKKKNINKQPSSGVWRKNKLFRKLKLIKLISDNDFCLKHPQFFFGSIPVVDNCILKAKNTRFMFGKLFKVNNTGFPGSMM